MGYYPTQSQVTQLRNAFKACKSDQMPEPRTDGTCVFAYGKYVAYRLTTRLTRDGVSNKITFDALMPHRLGFPIFDNKDMWSACNHMFKDALMESGDAFSFKVNPKYMQLALRPFKALGVFPTVIVHDDGHPLVMSGFCDFLYEEVVLDVLCMPVRRI